jgi:hypothetical protein
VAAREATCPLPHASTHFDHFFAIFFSSHRKWLNSNVFFRDFGRKSGETAIIFGFRNPATLREGLVFDLGKGG